MTQSFQLWTSPLIISMIRYFLTGERFDAAEATRIGLIQAHYPSVEEIDVKLDQIIGDLLSNSPTAVRDCKDLIRRVAFAPIEHGPIGLKAELCSKIATARVSKEGQEGLGSFLERRKPFW